MKLLRRQFLHLATGAVALPAVSHFAWAQAYPNRYVRLVVLFPPGGSTDPAARVLDPMDALGLVHHLAMHRFSF